MKVIQNNPYCGGEHYSYKYHTNTKWGILLLVTLLIKATVDSEMRFEYIVASIISTYVFIYILLNKQAIITMAVKAMTRALVMPLSGLKMFTM